MTDIDLLPCPFCGSPAALYQWRDTLNPHATWIECTNSTCGVMTDTAHDAAADAAKRMAAAIWNRRVAQ